MHSHGCSETTCLSQCKRSQSDPIHPPTWMAASRCASACSLGVWAKGCCKSQDRDSHGVYGGAVRDPGWLWTLDQCPEGVMEHKSVYSKLLWILSYCTDYSVQFLFKHLKYQKDYSVHFLFKYLKTSVPLFLWPILDYCIRLSSTWLDWHLPAVYKVSVTLRAEVLRCAHSLFCQMDLCFWFASNFIIVYNTEIKHFLWDKQDSFLMPFSSENCFFFLCILNAEKSQVNQWWFQDK